jgi:hypothetical protein
MLATASLKKKDIDFFLHACSFNLFLFYVTFDGQEFVKLSMCLIQQQTMKT